MVDCLTTAERSALMARVRGRGNATTEGALAAILRAAGIKGWRRGSRLPGRPDLVFARARLAVFVDGCFWHGCPKHHRLPTTRRAFWRGKVRANRARDRRVDRELRALGWRVLRIWEHALRVRSAPATLARVARALRAAPGTARR